MNPLAPQVWALRRAGYSLAAIAREVGCAKSTAQMLVSKMPQLATPPPPPPSATCQWPIGEPRAPGFRFCGAVAQVGRPYCAEHCRMAYVRRSEREAA